MFLEKYGNLVVRAEPLLQAEITDVKIGDCLLALDFKSLVGS